MELVTGLELTRSFARELCHYAHLAVERTSEPEEKGVEQANTGEKDLPARGPAVNPTASYTELDDASILALYVSSPERELCSALLPPFRSRMALIK